METASGLWLRCGPQHVILQIDHARYPQASKSQLHHWLQRWEESPAPANAGIVELRACQVPLTIKATNADHAALKRCRRQSKAPGPHGLHSCPPVADWIVPAGHQHNGTRSVGPLGKLHASRWVVLVCYWGALSKQWYACQLRYSNRVPKACTAPFCQIILGSWRATSNTEESASQLRDGQIPPGP